MVSIRAEDRFRNLAQGGVQSGVDVQAALRGCDCDHPAIGCGLYALDGSCPGDVVRQDEAGFVVHAASCIVQPCVALV